MTRALTSRDRRIGSPGRPGKPVRTRAGVIAIGDELVLGRTVDTNSSAICRWLLDHGLRVQRVEVVGDAQEAITQAMVRLAGCCDLIIVTGGLGPTDDDRTRDALAAAMGVPLREPAGLWTSIQRRFAAMRPGLPARAVAPCNRRQAAMPQGCSILHNDRGTAPGMVGRVGEATIVCLPGVPHEMLAMLDRLGTALGRLLPDLRVPRVGEIYLAGIGESDVQELLAGLFSEVDPLVGITASELGHLCLRVVGSPDPVRRRIALMKSRVSAYIIPGPGLAPTVVQALSRKGLTITTAESLTCGLVAAQLGSVPGASRVLHEGLVVYADEVKCRRLGVPAGLISREGVVSAAVAMAMARGARRRNRADIAVATTGVAGPGGGTRMTPVGTVHVAVAGPTGVHSRELRLSGSRDRIQRRAAASALLMAWEEIRRLATDRSRLGRHT